MPLLGQLSSHVGLPCHPPLPLSLHQYPLIYLQSCLKASSGTIPALPLHSSASVAYATNVAWTYDAAEFSGSMLTEPGLLKRLEQDAGLG